VCASPFPIEQENRKMRRLLSHFVIVAVAAGLLLSAPGTTPPRDPARRLAPSPNGEQSLSCQPTGQQTVLCQLPAFVFDNAGNPQACTVTGPNSSSVCWPIVYPEVKK
jgi:hypothetical protein